MHHTQNLTVKQKQFIDEYLIDSNATQAAIRAGYSKKTAQSMGSKLLSQPGIRRVIDEVLEEIHSEKVADAKEVMTYLTAVMRGEDTEEVPILCGEGCQRLTDKKLGTKERIKAAELLGKRYGIFTEKLDLIRAIPVVIAGEGDLEE